MNLLQGIAARAQPRAHAARSADDRFRVTLDYGQVGADRNLRRAAALFPVLQRTDVEAEQRYMIQLVGEAEKAKILAYEGTLLHDLCAYRDFLCVTDMKR